MQVVAIGKKISTAGTCYAKNEGGFFIDFDKDFDDLQAEVQNLSCLGTIVGGGGLLAGWFQDVLF